MAVFHLHSTQAHSDLSVCAAQASTQASSDLSVCAAEASTQAHSDSLLTP